MATNADLLAAVSAGDADLVRRLVGADPSLANARGEDGLSALLLARYRFDRPVLDALLAADPEMDVFEAAALGRLDRLAICLEKDSGAGRAMAADGFTALHLAAFFGKAEAARVLLQAGARVDAVGANALANQPLHAATAGRHFEVCRVLLAAGADVNASQHGGYTPLHQAAQNGDVELAELFLSAGANVAAAAEKGLTAADLAQTAGHGDLASRLRTFVRTDDGNGRRR
ncbi:MAG: ankyrin repeat domain-containing protein [Candidatus Limnocylindrales bacterium]